MTSSKRDQVSRTDALLGHLASARSVAARAGLTRTNILIEQAICTVMLEYHRYGDGLDKEPHSNTNAA